MDSQGRFTHAIIRGQDSQEIFSGTITECENFWDNNIVSIKTPAGRIFYIAASPDIIVNNKWEYK